MDYRTDCWTQWTNLTWIGLWPGQGLYSQRFLEFFLELNASLIKIDAKNFLILRIKSYSQSNSWLRIILRIEVKEIYAIPRFFLRLSIILRNILRIQILAYVNRKLELFEII